MPVFRIFKALCATLTWHIVLHATTKRSLSGFLNKMIHKVLFNMQIDRSVDLQ